MQIAKSEQPIFAVYCDQADRFTEALGPLSSIGGCILPGCYLLSAIPGRTSNSNRPPIDTSQLL